MNSSDTRSETARVLDELEQYAQVRGDDWSIRRLKILRAALAASPSETDTVDLSWMCRARCIRPEGHQGDHLMSERLAAAPPRPASEPTRCDHRSIIGGVQGGKVVSTCEACGQSWTYPDLPPASEPAPGTCPACPRCHGTGRIFEKEGTAPCGGKNCAGGYIVPAPAPADPGETTRGAKEDGRG